MLLGIAQTGSKAVKYSSLNVANPRGVGPVTGAILVLPRLVVTGWYLHEMTKNSVGDTLTAAIPGEVSNLSSYASKVSYWVAISNQEPAVLIKSIAISTIEVSTKTVISCVGDYSGRYS